IIDACCMEALFHEAFCGGLQNLLSWRGTAAILFRLHIKKLPSLCRHQAKVARPFHLPQHHGRCRRTTGQHTCVRPLPAYTWPSRRTAWRLPGCAPVLPLASPRWKAAIPFRPAQRQANEPALRPAVSLGLLAAPVPTYTDQAAWAATCGDTGLPCRPPLRTHCGPRRERWSYSPLPEL